MQRNLNISTFIFTIMLVMAGCEKDKDQDMDYRISYIGSFIFSSYAYSRIYMADTTYYSDTITFNGSINLDNVNDSAIIIHYLPSDSMSGTCYGTKTDDGCIITAELNVNGALRLLSDNVNQSFARMTGKYCTPDSLNFEIWQESAGGKWGQVVTGERN